MEISEIKVKLPLKDVLAHYGLKPDKHARLHCPFHRDRTPSLQVYYKTQTCFCFSTNCPTNGRAMDVVDFIMHKEGITKHEAILKAKAMVGGEKPSDKAAPPDRRALLGRLFTYFKNAVHNSRPAQGYLQRRGLDFARLEVGYNTGQFHHGKRKEAAFIEACLEVGLLRDEGLVSRTGDKAYKVFAKGCVVFPLKDGEGHIVGLYFRSTTDDKEQKHFYLKDRQGLYPNYPERTTRKLILTESVIDAASLLQQGEIASEYGVLALYGTNGLTEEHKEAIKGLDELEELTLFLNGDEAGRKATEEHAETLKGLRPELAISAVDVPEEEDVNSLLQSHEPEVLLHLIEGRSFLLSNETSSEGGSDERKEPSSSLSNEPAPLENGAPKSNGKGSSEDATPEKGYLETKDPERPVYEKGSFRAAVPGGVSSRDLHRLRVTLALEKEDTGRAFRDGVDLYGHKSRKAFLEAASEELNCTQGELRPFLEGLTRALENFRGSQRKEQEGSGAPKPPELSEKERQESLQLLKQGEPLTELKKALEKEGLVGEEKSGLLLFLIFLTRFFDAPLHGLVHGASGSGKTHLLKSVMALLPEEQRFATTALTEGVLFRPPTKDFWKRKVLMLEDLDGAYGALLALRELMSNQRISKFASEPDPKTGRFRQVLLEAEGPVVIAGATTRDRVYEDNANRSFLLHVSEGPEQEKKVLEHQKREAAGLIDKSGRDLLRQKVRNLQRVLDPRIEVVNPFQPELELPPHVFKKLRTNTHYIALIRAVAFLHQYQREIKRDRNERPYIEATLDDVAVANDLARESLLRKSDELSGRVRSFFEDLKAHLKKEGQESFLAKEVRAAFRMNPMSLNRRLRELESLGRIRRSGGNKKQGYEYEVLDWEDQRALEKGLKLMEERLEKLWARCPDGRYRPPEESKSNRGITEV